ncbi:hypothetical protein D3C72_1565080 [compost metagenome]
MHLVGLAAIERFFICIEKCRSISRSCADMLNSHGRSDACCVKEHKGAGIPHADSIIFKEIASSYKRSAPCAVWIKIGFGKACAIGIGTCCSITYHRSLDKDCLHSGVGRKGLSFFNADSSQQTQCFSIHRCTGLFLYNLVYFFKKVIIHRVNGVESFSGDIKEICLSRICCL